MSESANHTASGGVAPWRRALPNAMTVSRIAMTVVLFAMLAPYSYADPARTEPQPMWTRPWWLVACAAVFAAAALTDVLDGYLARRWRTESVFGRIMDPFADKLLVIGTFIFLAGPGFHVRRGGAGSPSLGCQVSGVAPWMVAVILGRELLVTSIRAAVERLGVDFGATVSGKLKMALQSVCAPAVLVLVGTTPTLPPIDGPAPPARWIIDALVWLTVAVTAWSGVPYVARAVGALRADGAGAPGDGPAS